MPAGHLGVCTRSSPPFSKEQIMNARMAPLAVALSLFATTAYAADLNLGTTPEKHVAFLVAEKGKPLRTGAQ